MENREKVLKAVENGKEVHKMLKNMRDVSYHTNVLGGKINTLIGVLDELIDEVKLLNSKR